MSSLDFKIKEQVNLKHKIRVLAYPPYDLIYDHCLDYWHPSALTSPPAASDHFMEDKLYCPELFGDLGRGRSCPRCNIHINF